MQRTRVAATGNAPGPTWLAGPASTTLHALDGWPPRSAGTGARFSAHEIASALTGHRREGAQPRHPCSPPVGSVPVSFTPVRSCSPADVNRLPRSGKLAAGGGRPGAVLESVCCGQPQSSPWAHFWAHSSPSRAVRRRSRRARLRTSRTVADHGERWPAVLESVLGASPREFESRILRHADLQECP